MIKVTYTFSDANLEAIRVLRGGCTDQHCYNVNTLTAKDGDLRLSAPNA